LSSIASTYARAFADLVLDSHLDAARAIAGLREIAELFVGNRDLRRVWENPAMPSDRKRRVLDAIVKREGIEKPVRNFVAVVIDHRRMHFLPRIARELEKELNEALGFAEARISSARQLADPEKRALETQLEKVTGKKVKAQYGLDASLLGGAVVRVGSTIYDGSVKGQLDRIKEAISS
jgi:F-type H+-transporting ATPase subunit delta